MAKAQIEHAGTAYMLLLQMTTMVTTIEALVSELSLAASEWEALAFRAPVNLGPTSWLKATG